MRCRSLLLAAALITTQLVPSAAEAELRLREVAISYPGANPVPILLQPDRARSGYRLAQPVRFALDTRGRIRNTNQRRHAILEADLALYAPGYPKPADPGNNPSAIRIMEFGQPRADVEQRNVLSWQDANLSYVRPAWDAICRQRRDRTVASRHELELTASVRVRAGVRLRALDIDTYGTGNPHPGWRGFETHSEHIALPVIIACPAENVAVAHHGADRAREQAREGLDVERVVLTATRLNNGSCPRHVFLRAEFEGRGRGLLEYEIRSSNDDRIFRRVRSLERRPDNRFEATDDVEVVLNATTERIYWVQTLRDPGSTRSQPATVSIRCGGTPNQTGDFTFRRD